MPVGLATALLPGVFTVTVAVKVTPWPLTDGLADETTAAVVPSLLTTWLSDPEAALALKLVSPLVYWAVMG